MVLCVGAGVLLFYVNRLFAELPLYAGDEGAYLIQALYARERAWDPQVYPSVQPVANTLYFAIVRLVDALSLNVIPWMRLIGALSYFGGLALLYLVAARECGRKTALGFLLIAAVFPYYRFAFAAMPDGVYAGLLCLIAFVVYRVYATRPLLGAALVGVLAASLVLVKPHGVVVVPAFVALCLVQAVVGRGLIPPLLGRLALFAAAFMAAGVGIELAAGRSLEEAMTFFRGSAYAQHLGHEAAARAPAVAALSAASMGGLCAVLLSVPLIAAVAGWLRDRREGARAFSAGDLALLFAALCLAGTLAMVTIFAFRMAGIEAETKRLWGRYFEFYTPMLWLLAARPLAAWERLATMRGRLLAGTGVLAGLGALLCVFAFGVRLFPWDGTAVTAFASPDVVAFPFGDLGGSRLIAVLATVAVAVATAAGVSVRAAWPAYFVVLGLLSTRADDAWVGEIAQRWRAIEHELHVAEALAVERAAPAVVFVDGLNEGHLAYLGLQGRARIRLASPGPIPARPLAGFNSAVVIGPHPMGVGWRKVFEGRELTIYAREAPAR